MKRKKDDETRLPIFRERFEVLRAGRSNTEFAEFLGMSRQTVGFYLNGDRIPDAIGLMEIAQKCNVSADWLLGLSDTKSLDGEEKQVCKYTGLSRYAISQLHKMSLDNSYVNKLGIDFIEKLLDRHIIRFEDCAWHSVFAEVQAERAESYPHLHEDILDGFPISLDWLDVVGVGEKEWQEERSKRDEKLIEEVRKPKGQASSHIEISAYEYSRLYHDRAMKIIEDVAHLAILDYKKNVKKSIDEDQ